MHGIRFYQTGSWVLIAFGIAHLGGHFAGRKQPPANATGKQLQDLMRGHKVDMMGVMRSTSDILEGFSLAMSILTIAIGVLCLLIARSRNSRLTRNTSVLNTAWLAVLLCVSIALWFPIPTAFLAVALACYAIAIPLTGRAGN